MPLKLIHAHPVRGGWRSSPFKRAFSFDGDTQRPAERSATFKSALAHVQRANLCPRLPDRFAFLIDLLLAQGTLGLFLI
jgi:hypothetical protein